jgi:hypothetical protein
VAGCALIAGIEKIELIDPPDAPAECVLGDDGTAFLRLGNLVPSDEHLDFCIKAADGSGFDGLRPVFVAAGTGCPAGLRYRDITMAFRTKPGSYDVRVVAGGAQACDVAVAELAGVRTVDNRTTTVLAFDGAPGAPLLRQLPESPRSVNRSQVRFVNALAGPDRIDCGVADSPRRPASIQTPVFRDVKYGNAAPADESPIGAIDGNGYLVFTLHGATVPFAIAEPGDTEALVSLATTYRLSTSNTLFAVGHVGDTKYPPALWSCDENATEGVLATCGDPLQVKVEVFSSQLTDLFTPLFRQRVDPVIHAIANGDSDVICVNEIRNPKHVESLLAKTASTYRYTAASYSMDASPSDLTDKNLVLPAAPESAACMGELTDELDELMDCVESHCTEDDGKGEHFVDDGTAAANCVMSRCLEHATPLALGDNEADLRCWMCALTQMSGEETTEYVREACTTDPAAGFAYRGQQGLVVLSRHPIREAQRWLLPSTGWQRGLIRAAIDLPNGVALDFYCGDLSLPQAEPVVLYVGAYGGDEQGPARWVAEQQLQAERAVGLVRKHSGSNGARVVLAMTTYAGPEVEQGGVVVLAARSRAVYDTLLAAFSPLVAPGYIPTCTECTANPVFSASDAGGATGAGAWTSHLFGSGIAAEAVLSSAVTFTKASYPVSTPDGSRMIPPSLHYGLRSVLRLTQ